MVYTIGLIFVIILLLISIDDIIWDIVYFFKKISGKIKIDSIDSIDAKDIEATKPKMLAVIVAAYNEESVLRSVIRNVVLSSQYPRSMYHIFIGVYPNDSGTMRVAQELETEFTNVHEVIHTMDGPSSKADNLNNVIKNIYLFEKRNHIKFAAIVIHDSEDLVHPYEFKMENYLLEKYPAIQMPVFPLQEKPRLSNIFKNMVSGTYADEFAENHYRLLVARTVTKAFVPSAGTGFVIRRDVLEKFPYSNVFPVRSMTEDYKLSLQLKQMGYDVHYALENVKRLKADGSVVRDFISTRSMFPSTYKAAVRQKTRWIYGISMQSFKLRDILKSENLNLSSKYSFYRDWKAKIGNLILGPGYLIFAYFIYSLFFDVPVMFRMCSFSWFLTLFLTLIMLERQVLRFIAVKNVYGIRSGIISSFFPPLLPIRMVLGNIINFHSTVKAWIVKLSGNQKRRSKKKFAWSKTDHEFLEDRILESYRRNLGDTLLYKGLIDSRALSMGLDLAKISHEKLGATLKRIGVVSAEDIVKSICELLQKPYLNICFGRFMNKYKLEYGEKLLKQLNVVPIFNTSKGLVVLATLEVDEVRVRKAFIEDDISFVYTTDSNMHTVLNNPVIDCVSEENLESTEKYIEEGAINLEQAILALNFTEKGTSIKNTFNEMGLLIDKL